MAKIKTYQDLRGRKWVYGGIPKWIFRTGASEHGDLPEEIQKIHFDILEKNPDYEMFYFSDKDCVDFILGEYGQKYLDEYNAFLPTAYKADYFRYCLLNTYGGCYGDFTQIPLIPYNQMIMGVDRVLVRDDGSGSKGNLYNALMCIKAGDPILKRCLDIIEYNISIKYFGHTPVDVTGPTVLGRAFRDLNYNDSDAFDISLGDYNASRIYMHNGQDQFLRDINDNHVAITKVRDIHNATLYSPTNKHYHVAWHDGEIYA